MAIQFIQQLAVDEATGALYNAVTDQPLLAGITTAQTAAVQALVAGAGNVWPSPRLRSDGQFGDLPYTPRRRFQLDAKTSAWKDVIGGTALTRTGTAVYAAHPVWNTRKAETFNGAAVHYVTAPNALVGSVNGPVTILVLVKPNMTRAAATTETRYLFQWSDPTTNKGVYCQLVYNFTGSAPYANTTTAVFSTSQEFPVSGQDVLNTQTDIPNGAMAVIGWTNDGTTTNRNNRLYVNGVCESAGICPYTSITPTTADFLIGIRNTLVGSTSMKGDIVEVIVFDRCLTTAEMMIAYKTLIGTGVERTIFFDDGDTDTDAVDALAVEASLAYSGSRDLRAVVLDGVGVKAAPAWRCFLNYLGFDFVPIYQQQGSIQVAYGAAPGDWCTGVTTAFRTPSTEDRTATTNATSSVNTANVNYPNVLPGIKAELTACPDASVIVTMQGFANTMLALLQDAPGLALFTSKVKRAYGVFGWWYDATQDVSYVSDAVYVTNGTVTGAAEYNANRDQTNWKTLFTLWPAAVPLRIVPTELGFQARWAPYAGKLISVSPMAKACALFNGYSGSSDAAAATAVATTHYMWGTQMIVASVDHNAVFSEVTPVGRVVVQTALIPAGGIGGLTAIDQSQTTFSQTYLRLGSGKLSVAAIKAWAQTFTAAWMP